MNERLKDLHELDAAELANVENQKVVFANMLRLLENEGLCRHVYHRLAMVLFNDDLEQ